MFLLPDTRFKSEISDASSLFAHVSLVGLMGHPLTHLACRHVLFWQGYKPHLFRFYRVLTIVYNTQNYWGFGLFGPVTEVSSF
jgi:hypothetical protein